MNRPMGLLRRMYRKTPILRTLILTYSRIAGKNIANPTAMILCVALMFRYSFNMEKEARQIEDAVRTVLDKGIRTSDLGGKAGTKEFGDAVVVAL